MLTLREGARDAIAMLRERGFCPSRVAVTKPGGLILAAWVKGEFTDDDAVRALVNLEVLSGKSLKPEKDYCGRKKGEKGCPECPWKNGRPEPQV